MKWLTFFFVLFITLVIVLADMGILARYVGFVYAMPYGDKVGHFILFGILALLINLTVFRSRSDPSSSLGTSRKLLTVKTGLILALLIGLEEFSQRYFAHRTFSGLDLSFSYLGVIAFSWMALKIKK